MIRDHKLQALWGHLPHERGLTLVRQHQNPDRSSLWREVPAMEPGLLGFTGIGGTPGDPDLSRALLDRYVHLRSKLVAA